MQWVLPDGRVIVVDRENNRLRVFSPEGAFLDIWTGFAKPLDLWGDAAGRVYVADLVPTLTLLSPRGERLGRCKPELNGAHGVCGDKGGNFYLAEPAPSRVTRLVPIGAADPVLDGHLRKKAMQKLDLLVRGGNVVTGFNVSQCDIGVNDGSIVRLGVISILPLIRSSMRQE